MDNRGEIWITEEGVGERRSELENREERWRKEERGPWVTTEGSRIEEHHTF